MRYTFLVCNRRSRRDVHTRWFSKMGKEASGLSRDSCSAGLSRIFFVWIAQRDAGK